MGLLDGMIEMLKQRNLTCAGILVRTQVDNCMRVFAAFIAEDRTEFIDAFLKGEKIRNIKDNQGRKMKDVVLKERLAEYDKYLKMYMIILRDTFICPVKLFMLVLQHLKLIIIMLNLQ